MNRSIIYAVLAFGLTAVSCSKSDLQQAPVPGENQTAVGISLSAGTMEAPTGSLSALKSKASPNEALSVEYGAATKAIPSLTADEEQKVSDLWVIQFDKASGNLVGQPFYASAEQISQSGVNVSLEARLTTASSAQIVYFVANTHSPSVFHVGNCATVAAMEKVCRQIGNDYRPSSSGLPMLAAVEFPRIASGTPLNGITLRRLVAKVSLRYKVSSAMQARGFTVTGVRLRNVAGTIWYATEQSGAVDFPAAGPESHIDYLLEKPADAGTDGDYQTFTWYLPENLRKAVTSVSDEWSRVPANTDGAATYIEIQGEMKNPDKCQRIAYTVMLGAISENVNDYNVKRNTVYTVKVDIQGINPSDRRVTVGSFDMSNSAMVVPASGDAGAVTFDIRKLTSGWQTTMPALGVDAALRAEVLWSDVASIIKPADITLDKVNGLLTVKSSQSLSGNAVIALYDNASSGGNVLWSWHVWVTDYNPDGTKNYGLGLNSKAVVKGGQVHTYGTQYAAKNPGKVIMDRNLGAAKAYYNAPAAGDASADQCFGMFYQWGRKDPLPRADGSTIDATTGDATTIPIYGADGITVLPEDGTGYRKVNITGAGVISGTNTLAYAVKNPLTFIYNTATPFDWYTNAAANQNNDLWGDGAMKSAYDPCPAGWRIAPNGTWSDFTRSAPPADPLLGTFPYSSDGVSKEDYAAGDYKATNGRLYKVSASGNGTPLAWYPAPGNRGASLGVLGGVGNAGYNWTSGMGGASGIYGMILWFNATGLNPANTTARASGYQVRCIQE